MSPDSTFVSDWMRPTEHVEKIKTTPKPCPSTPRYFIKAEKCWPYFCRMYGTCPPWECTRGAIELWKTSKLIHAPLIIDSQHSGRAACDPSDGTHSWCPLPLTRVLTRYGALRMCRSVSRTIEHRKLPESHPPPPSLGYSVFAVRALASTCHVKRLAYFGSHQALHQNEIRRVWLVPVSEVYALSMWVGCVDL